ncbi:O-antigen ligase family protein [Paenibacillus caseinilyticus]|uniref:Polymerase n=1 Tax=Paenibacillus mucilaginosus K02 TaxID=997761 RepID=I0BBB8_9BACL|nr:O-antigen ligase family protein [Paenibacillus mucilaginosus]AFH59665.1 polymerase [Paenibacillus mucilaginosus K02]
MSAKQQYSYTAGLKKSSDSPDKSSILFWILACITIIFLVWSPFQRGLFNGNNFDFEGPIYSSFVWASIIFIVVGIYLYFQWKMEVVADLTAMLIWLLPLTYLISTISAASSKYATNMVYIQIIYAAFFTIGYYLTKNNRLGLTLLKNATVTTSYVILWFGMLNWLGNKEFAYSLVKWFAAAMQDNFYLHAVMSDSNGPRLTSVFQYANTYAGFLIALLFIAVYLVVTSKKWIVTAVHSFMIVPIIISFFVTLSRGGFVILPFVLLTILPFLKAGRQLLYLLHLVLSFGLSFIILNKITTIGVEQFNAFNPTLASSGWTSLLIVSLIYSVLAVLIQQFAEPLIFKFSSRFEEKSWSRFSIPAAAIIVGVLIAGLLLSGSGITKLLPENIRTRVENINFQQHSVLERGTFYTDALKLFSDYPIIGAGGGAWASMYEKYQNNPYTSRQAHNFYLQYLTEVGIIGFVILAAILILIFYIFLRNYMQHDEEERASRFVFYILAISLLIHSALDFDLSYVYLGFILFLCLGVMISNDKLKLKSISASNQSFSQKIRWVYPSIILVISVILFFNAVQLVSANRHFKTFKTLAATGQSSLNEILTPLNRALEIEPTHPDYVLQKVALLLQAYNQTKDEKYFTEADTLLQQARQKEPYNYFLTERQIYNYITKEKTQEALELANTEINNFPWKVELYELSISLNTDLGHKARESGNAEQQNQHWDAALATLKQFEEKQKHLATLPKEQGQGNPFNITPRMSLALGQIYFFRGNHAEAENMFKNSIGGSLDDAAVVQNIRWYLAALQKQGKNDQALMDKLLAKDPTEKQKIESLVNAKL